MDEYLTNTEDMSIVANAIRAKGGTSAPLEFPHGMAQAIEDIPTGSGGDPTLVDAILDGSVTSIETNASILTGYGLYERTNLEKFSAPNMTELGDRSLTECRALTSLLLPRASTIGILALGNTKKLKKVDFPVVERMARLVFSNAGIETLILRGSVGRIEKDTFNGSPIAKGTGYVYVPKALVDQYKVATNWVQFADQIRAIEDYPEITGG